MSEEELEYYINFLLDQYQQEETKKKDTKS